MNLNIFTYVFWPEQFLVNELAETLVKEGHQVQVMTGLPNYPQGDFYPGYDVKKGPYLQEHLGIAIRRYPIFPRKKGFPRLALNYLSHFVGGIFTQYYLPKANWAFVFATSPITTAIPALFWAKLNGAKVCIWLQDLWPDSVAAVGATSRKSLFYKLAGYIVQWIYNRTDLILVQSPGFLENLKEFNYSGPRHVVPNWAPELDFSNSTKPTWLNEKKEQFLVTFAGNVGKAQAIDTVIEAARALKLEPHVRFAIVGDGSELTRIKELSQRENLTNLDFYGRKPLSDMPGLFIESDALLVSLKKDPIFARTIPSKVQAYMASGKPLIASLDGVGAQVVTEARCGLTCPAEDAKALAEAILKLSRTEPQVRQQMGDNAKRYFYENYQKNRIIGQILEYLERYK